MKTTIILTVFCSIISLSTFAQLKVDPLGHVGIGTNWPNSGFKLDVRGNILITNYPATPNYALTLKVGNGWPGTEIGASGDQIAFWESWSGYNKLYAEQFYKQSDSTLKSNIVPIKGGLNRVMKLNVYSYSLKDNQLSKTGEKIEGIKTEYGFLSQEVEKEFPEVKITDDVLGVKLMDYDQIIPLTVAAIKEQQLIIDSLKIELENLKDVISHNLNNNGTVGVIDNAIIKETVLYQNRPNPFNERTIIEYEIEVNNFSSGSIVVFDMNGTLLKSYPINETGKNQLTINGGELKAGMYIYSLIVNNKDVDTKRMILLK